MYVTPVRGVWILLRSLKNYSLTELCHTKLHQSEKRLNSDQV